MRVSRDGQGLGIEAQRTALKQWCEQQGVTAVGVFTDEGISGAADLERRPGLLRALDALSESRAGVLLVAKRDRIARDTLMAAMIERLVERAGGRVVTANGAGNGTGPEALLMRRMIDAFSEYERSLIRARTRAALAVKKAKGERVGDPPYGMQVAADGCHLEPHPMEQLAVQLAADYRREGLSYRAIGERLVDAGHNPRRGGAWHTQTVARLVGRAHEIGGANAT